MALLLQQCNQEPAYALPCSVNEVLKSVICESMISNTGKSLQTFKKALLDIDSGPRDFSPYHYTMADVLARTFLIYRFIVTTLTIISSQCLISLVNALMNIFSALTPITAVTPR